MLSKRNHVLFVYACESNVSVLKLSTQDHIQTKTVRLYTQSSFLSCVFPLLVIKSKNFQPRKLFWEEGKQTDSHFFPKDTAGVARTKGTAMCCGNCLHPMLATTFSSLLLLLPPASGPEAAVLQGKEHLVPLTAKAQRQQGQQTTKTGSFCLLWAANGSRDRARQLPCTAPTVPQPLPKASLTPVHSAGSRGSPGSTGHQSRNFGQEGQTVGG